MLQRAKQAMQAFVKKALEAEKLHEAYKDRPPYQRNDYLMWINTAKRDETKQKRLRQMIDELKQGNVYMKMKWSPKK